MVLEVKSTNHSGIIFFFSILTEIVLSSFDFKLFIFLGQKMKSLPDTPNVMKPC